MSPLDHIYAPAEVLKLVGLNLREKLLLSPVISCAENGLFAKNKELAGLLNTGQHRVSDLLVSLERKGYVEIVNKQSRHRRGWTL